jgi:hypothetical protein
MNSSEPPLDTIPNQSGDSEVLTPCQIRIVGGEDELRMLLTGDLVARPLTCGYEINGHDDEFSLVIQYSYGQGREVVWIVTLLEVDAGLSYRVGKSPTDYASDIRFCTDLEQAVASITSHWLPEYRINSGK